MRSLVLPFVLGASLAAPVPAAAQDLGDAITGIAQTLLAQQVDRTAFAEAQRADTATAYRNYLSRFPNGLHKADAQRALERLGDIVSRPDPQPVTPPAADTPAALEAQIGLSRAQRLEIQQQLTRLGYDTRGADGLWGSNTRSAISRWQSANRHSVTGYVTARQVQMISDQFSRITPSRPAPGSDAERGERALDLTASERREIQLRLTLLGHGTQGTNGTFGPLTRSAISAWQRAAGETVTGYMTADQVRKLQRQTGG